MNRLRGNSHFFRLFLAVETLASPPKHLHFCSKALHWNFATNHVKLWSAGRTLFLSLLAHREHLFHWPAHIENNTIPTSTANSSLRSLALYYPARARSHLRASGRHACRTPGLRRPCSRAGRPRSPIITCQWSAGSAAPPPPRGRPSWRFFPVFPLFCSKVSIVSHGRAKARKC